MSCKLCGSTKAAINPIGLRCENIPACVKRQGESRRKARENSPENQARNAIPENKLIMLAVMNGIQTKGLSRDTLITALEDAGIPLPV